LTICVVAYKKLNQNRNRQSSIPTDGDMQVDKTKVKFYNGISEFSVEVSSESYCVARIGNITTYFHFPVGVNVTPNAVLGDLHLNNRDIKNFMVAQLENNQYGLFEFGKSTPTLTFSNVQELYNFVKSDQVVSIIL